MVSDDVERRKNGIEMKTLTDQEIGALKFKQAGGSPNGLPITEAAS
jgi:hypothetical protein